MDDGVAKDAGWMAGHYFGLLLTVDFQRIQENHGYPIALKLL